MRYGAGSRGELGGSGTGYGREGHRSRAATPWDFLQRPYNSTQSETCTDPANNPTKTTEESQLTTLQSQQGAATTPRQSYKNNPVHPRTQRPYNNNPHTQQPHNEPSPNNSYPRSPQTLPQPRGVPPRPLPVIPEALGAPRARGRPRGGPGRWAGVPRPPGGSPRAGAAEQRKQQSRSGSSSNVRQLRGSPRGAGDIQSRPPAPLGSPPSPAAGSALSPGSSPRSPPFPRGGRIPFFFFR